MKVHGNIAYIDGQNLYLGSKGLRKKDGDNPWKVDLSRFRFYLKRKFDVEKAFFYLGYTKNGPEYERLYESVQSAGFILVFRKHNSSMSSNKKGNVDTDIIFNAMKRVHLNEPFDKIVLVTGDGDYKPLVEFLIEQDKFEKILFPNRRYRSSLYKPLSSKYFVYLDDKDIKRKIEYKKPG